MSDIRRQQQLDQNYQDNLRHQRENTQMILEQMRRSQEGKDLQIWWQRFYQFFDQQRDELHRQQREWTRESVRQLTGQRHQMRHSSEHTVADGRAADAQFGRRPEPTRSHQEFSNPRLSEYVHAFHGRFSETPYIRELWEQCARASETAQNQYTETRRKFWRGVNDGESPNALFIQEMLKAAGYELLGGSRAPVLRIPDSDATGVSRLHFRLSIDHVDPQSQSREKAVAADNLRFMAHWDNAVRRDDTSRG